MDSKLRLESFLNLWSHTINTGSSYGLMAYHFPLLWRQTNHFHYDFNGFLLSVGKLVNLKCFAYCFFFFFGVKTKCSYFYYAIKNPFLVHTFSLVNDDVMYNECDFNSEYPKVGSTKLWLHLERGKMRADSDSCLTKMSTTYN